MYRRMYLRTASVRLQVDRDEAPLGSAFLFDVSPDQSDMLGAMQRSRLGILDSPAEGLHADLSIGRVIAGLFCLNPLQILCNVPNLCRFTLVEM